MLRLDPPIPLDTPHGPGLAHIVLDYGIDHDLQWVVFIRATGECWTFRNSDVRAVTNATTKQKV